MTVPPPNIWFGSTPSGAAEPAAALSPQPSLECAAAEPFDESSIAMEEVREAPVVTPPNTIATGATDCIDHIHEIFHFARKLGMEARASDLFDKAAITERDEILYRTLKALDKPETRDLADIPDPH